MRFKFLFCLLFWIVPFFVKSQDSVNYSLVFQDCCTEKLKTHGTNYSKWYVIDIHDSVFIPINNQVKLICNNSYFLSNEGFGIVNEPIILEFNDRVDTIITTCINIVYPDVYFTWTPLYLNCGDTINGEFTEYYPNGNIRLKGNFKNGYVVDSLVKFYSNASIKSIDVIDDDRITHKTFFPNGQTSYSYDSKKKFRISYFDDGFIKSKQSNTSNKSFNRYSRDQLWYKIKKTKQISYYRNGEIHQKLKRKPLFFFDRLRPNKQEKTFSYSYYEHDTTGTIIKRVRFYEKGFPQLYTAHFYSALRDFSNLTYYENGREKAYFQSVRYEGEQESYTIMYHYSVYDNVKGNSFRDLFRDEFEQIKEEYEEKIEESTKLKSTK